VTGQAVLDSLQAPPIFSNEVTAAGCFAVSCHNYNSPKCFLSAESDQIITDLIAPQGHPPDPGGDWAIQVLHRDELARSQRWHWEEHGGEEEEVSKR
jgi:hypothetical protein